MAASAIELSIVIPTYNEAKRIGSTLEELSRYIKKQKHSVEVIVVDASSPDKTAQISSEYAEKFANFSVIDAGPKPAKKAIKGLQVKKGMLHSKGKYAVFMDADLATPLKYLNNVFEMIDNNSQIGICVRNLQASHKGLRKLVSSAGNFLVQLVILPGIPDTQCGFKAFSRKAIEDVFPKQKIMGWGFDMEILAIARTLGYQIETFAVPDWQDVQEGSKISDSKFSTAKAALSTLPDVAKIKWRMLRGKYRS